MKHKTKILAWLLSGAMLVTTLGPAGIPVYAQEQKSVEETQTITENDDNGMEQDAERETNNLLQGDGDITDETLTDEALTEEALTEETLADEDPVLQESEAPVMLKELSFFGKGSSDVVEVLDDPEDGPDEFTILVGEELRSFCMEAYLNAVEGIETPSMEVVYTNTKGEETRAAVEEGQTFEFKNLVKNNGDAASASFVLEVRSGDLLESYTVHVVRDHFLKALKVLYNGTNLLTFNKRDYDYSLYVPADAETVELRMEAYYKGTNTNRYFVDGQEIPYEGKEGIYQIPMDADEKTVVVKAEKDDLIPREYTIHLEKGDIPLLNSVQLSGEKEVKFDKNKEAVLGLDVAAPSLKIKFKASLGVTAPTEIRYAYTDAQGEAQDVVRAGSVTSYQALEGALKEDGSPLDLTVTVTNGTATDVYTLHIVQKAIIAKMSVLNKSGVEIETSPAFRDDVYDYQVVTVEDQISFKPLVKKPGHPDIRVNDEKMEGDQFTADLKTGENVLNVSYHYENAEAVSYVFHVNRVEAAKLGIHVTPEDAQIALYDSGRNRVWPDAQGKFNLFPGDKYEYNISRPGYVSQKEAVSISGSRDLEIELQKAPKTELPSLSADYAGFRSGDDNMSVMDIQTPITPAAIQVKWERQMGDYVRPTSGTTPIIVDNKIYTISNDTIYVLDKETGEIIKSGKAVTNAGFALIPPTYADGMLFVPLNNGIIQCFNAETLESLWVYTDPNGGQVNSPIRYDDGYVYIGFFTGKDAGFVCLNVTDEDPSDPLEEKIPAWRDQTLGAFYWNGAWTNENYMFVSANSGEIYCLDKRTGKIIESVNTGSQTRTDIAYYNGRIYAATQGGYLFAVNLDEDGTMDTEHRIEPLGFGGQSTSTPAIYNDRAYIGISNGGNFGVEGFAILVVDIDPETGAMTPAYAVPTDGFVQTSGLVVTGYEDIDGYVYVYFTVNGPTGNVYMIKDKKGLTKADPASGLFYEPVHPQYCIASVAADKDGNMYLKNDSAWQFVLTKADAYLEDITVTGGNAKLDGGAAFAGNNDIHYIQVDPDTEKIHMEFKANKGTTITVNGTKGDAFDLELKENSEKVEVKLQNGTYVRKYEFGIYKGPVFSSLRVDDSPNEGVNGSTVYPMDPEFDPAVREYVIGVEGIQSQAFVWPVALDPEDSVKMTVVSGISQKEPGDEITASQSYAGNKYYEIRFTGGKETPSVAKVKLTVSSKDGSQNTDYLLTLYTGDALPILSIDQGVISDRTDTGAALHITANKDGNFSYLILPEKETAPDEATILKEGTTVELKAGLNHIALENLDKEAYKIYMVLKDADERTSAIKEAEIPSSRIPGDMNEDGKVTNADAAELLNAITLGKYEDLSEVDLNGDGKLTNADAAALLDIITKS